MTLFLHQRWACEHAGFHRHDASDVTHVIDTLLSDSLVTLDHHRLARQAREALEVAALLSVTAARQSDTVLRLIEMRIAEIWSWAHAVARPEPRHHLPEEAACALARVMDDTEVSDAEYRERSRVLLAP